MSFSRRSFLVGAGAIVTTAFVKEATAYAADTKAPLLVTPPEAPNVLIYKRFQDHWRMHLGEPKSKIPKPQLLIENLRWHGEVLDTQEQIDEYCDMSGWTEEDLFAPMNGFDWETQWEHNLNPQAQAYQFLEKHDIFPLGGRGRRAGEVIFEEFSNPSSCWRWVEVHDPVSLSLLQGRLNELNLKTEVRAHG